MNKAIQCEPGYGIQAEYGNRSVKNAYIYRLNAHVRWLDVLSISCKEKDGKPIFELLDRNNVNMAYSPRFRCVRKKLSSLYDVQHCETTEDCIAVSFPSMHYF